MSLSLLFGRGRHAPYLGSVLPRIDARPSKDGMCLTVMGAGARKAWEIVYYAALLMVMIAILVVAHRVVMRAVSLGITIVLMASALLTEYLRWHRLRRATLTVRPWPIKFGAPVEARFRIFMRDAMPVEALAAKLECVEEVAIGAGRDAQHKRSTRYETALDTAHQTDRRHLTASWSFVVPEECPPSLKVPSNKVTWRVTATVTTDQVEIPIVFELLVVPEVAG